MSTRIKITILAAAAAAMLLLAGCGADEAQSQTSSGQVTDLGNAPANRPANAASDPANSGIELPKIELPEQSTATADMIGLFVYQGRIYTQTDTKIAPKDAKALLGEKVGRTIGTIDEWSGQDAFAAEFASSIGQADIYAVKGYDSTFRLMAYQEQEGGVWAELYECLNGLTVNSGADVLGLLQMNGNIASAQWETHDSWNYGKKQFQDVALGETMDAFIDALNEAKPVAHDTLYKQGIYESPDQRFVLLTLKDRSVVRLRLFKDGYVKYSNAPVFFQIDDTAFKAMWNALA